MVVFVLCGRHKDSWGKELTPILSTPRISIHKSKKCLFYVLSQPKNSRMTLRELYVLTYAYETQNLLSFHLAFRPWFMNSAMYPTKMKKWIFVGKRFFRSERAPTLRKPAIVFGSSTEVAIQPCYLYDLLRRRRMARITPSSLNHGKALPSLLAILP